MRAPFSFRLCGTIFSLIYIAFYLQNCSMAPRPGDSVSGDCITYSDQSTSSSDTDDEKKELFPAKWVRTNFLFMIFYNFISSILIISSFQLNYFIY